MDDAQQRLDPKLITVASLGPARVHQQQVMSQSLCAALADAKASKQLPSCFESHGRPVVAMSKGCWMSLPPWRPVQDLTPAGCCTVRVLPARLLHISNPASSEVALITTRLLGHTGYWCLHEQAAHPRGLTSRQGKNGSGGAHNRVSRPGSGESCSEVTLIKDPAAARGRHALHNEKARHAACQSVQSVHSRADVPQVLTFSVRCAAQAAVRRVAVPVSGCAGACPRPLPCLRTEEGRQAATGDMAAASGHLHDPGAVQRPLVRQRSNKHQQCPQQR